MLVLHPNAGNALFNAFNKEESLMVLGLKVEDPNIDEHRKKWKQLDRRLQLARKFKSIPREAGGAVAIVVECFPTQDARMDTSRTRTLA